MGHVMIPHSHDQVVLTMHLGRTQFGPRSCASYMVHAWQSSHTRCSCLATGPRTQFLPYSQAAHEVHALLHFAATLCMLFVPRSRVSHEVQDPQRRPAQSSHPTAIQHMSFTSHSFVSHTVRALQPTSRMRFMPCSAHPAHGSQPPIETCSCISKAVHAS